MDTQGELRHAAMIADELLPHGKIGAAITASGRKEFTSSPDQLFGGWPMAVLVGARTQGQGEWIAAALQDNGRAKVLGQRTPGRGFVQQTIVFDNGDAIELRSGAFERANGKPLVSHGQSAMSAQFSEQMRVMRARLPGESASPAEADAGWHGVQPDQLVTSRKGVEEAVAIVDELLRAAAEPPALQTLPSIHGNSN
jgi:carboxyl-terminal processing protease